MVDQTFYIVNEDEEASVLAKKMARTEALEYVRTHMTGIMAGKTFYVGFYSRGPIGAQAANATVATVATASNSRRAAPMCGTVPAGIAMIGLPPSAGLRGQLLHAPLGFLGRHVFNMRRQGPLVAERILECAGAVAVELILNRPDLGRTCR